MTSVAVGIDFGTTNSAVALAGPEGARLAPLPSPGGGTTPTWRTVLCFEPADDGKPSAITAGAPAIHRWAEREGEARLIQSIKSHLASSTFVDTIIFGKRWRVEDLIARYLKELRAATPVDLGRKAVVGRPVRYWGAETDEDDARAVGRMRTALAAAGFDDVTFAFEPVAAAHAYAARLDHDELVLIADFGGGTSDFSLVEVGPGKAEVRATTGVALAGDSFDARIIDHVVAPALGRGSRYKVEMGGEAPVPSWLYNKLRRWHHLSFLKSADTLALLERIRDGAMAPRAIEQLCHLVEDDLGLPLHAAVEKTKLALSRAPETTLAFVRPGIDVTSEVVRAAFDLWIVDELTAIDDAITDALAKAGATTKDVDRVFTTGGSSHVPAVRGVLAGRFGAERLVGGEELTSVAAGLAAMARL
ncbi:MAG: Hsp70 family protein [Deltaproteobacteria bacterium]|nr:Hsp70 family protein [Deltaproteobacteria bacterium]